MSKYLKLTLCVLSLFLLFTSCQKKAFEDFYERPDSLAEPIYQQLQARGNFTATLALINKAGYKRILGSAGYWTFFAPNDEAFNAYFQTNGISGVDDIDSAKAASLITFLLVENSYRQDQLSMLQTSKGPTPNSAYRRKTAYYDFAYKDPNHSGVVVSTNRNGTAYAANDNNNKYIPYFLDGYVSANGLGASDYNAFYPASVYSGFNVAGARVVTADIKAENGVIHEIDKVVTPLANLEQYIAGKPEYSEFKKLLDRVAVYTPNPALTAKYRALTGKPDTVFIKSYPSSLAFSPNNEAYLNVSQTDAQENGWTMAVPTNESLLAFEKEILVNFGTFEKAPPSVVTDLIKAHMWGTTVWPHDLFNVANAHVELATFNNSNIIDRQVLSNGNFYGTNAPQYASLFRSVYSKIYLDPKYSLMQRVFGQSDLQVVSTRNSGRYTLFMMSDPECRELGYDFNTDKNQWVYVNPATPTVTVESLTQDRLTRIAQTSLLVTSNGEFDNLSGEGIAESFGGEYVKFKANKVYASGNIVDGTAVTIDSVKNASNGKVYYTKGLLQFAENTETVGKSLERLATSSDPAVRDNYSYFFNYLSNCAALWDPLTKNIVGVQQGGLYTVFVPTNAAISQAVRDELLPGNKSNGTPAFSGLSVAQQQYVINFIQYHILDKTTIAIDGKKSGLYPSLLQGSNGDPKLLYVYYPGDPDNYVPGQMELRDGTVTGDPGASVNLAGSNNLGNRTLIHSINKVLPYYVNP
jgi:uncharacterized surface protein with fasciclin (FAS1) repeats